MTNAADTHSVRRYVTGSSAAMRREEEEAAVVVARGRADGVMNASMDVGAEEINRRGSIAGRMAEVM